MNKSPPLTVASISFLYVENEDRLALIVSDAADGQLGLMVTRRLAARMINGLASLLECTSPTAQEAPADVRADVVMFEHQGAVAIGSSSQQAQPTTIPKPKENQREVATVLIDSLDVTTHPDRFTISFKAGQKVLAVMNGTRPELHRVVAVLKRKAEDAGWKIQIETTWLDDSVSLTLN